ncbi:MAG: hypothetical protein AB1512_23100 [Thermodesulfobacteriota bacterium]
MADAIQIILGILILIGVYVLTQWGVALRIRKACRWVIKDLEMKQAFDVESAVELPYAKKEFFRMGLKDFRPKAVESLAAAGILGHTAEGKWYLLKRGLSL